MLVKQTAEYFGRIPSGSFLAVSLHKFTQITGTIGCNASNATLMEINDDDRPQTQRRDK
jgi:hypothetical protein